MLFGTYKGTNVLKLTEDGKAVTGQEGLYASAVLDKTANKRYIKLVNALDTDQSVEITCKGMKTVGQVESVLLTGDKKMENLVGKREMVKPAKATFYAEGNKIAVPVPARSFVVLSF